MLTPKNGRQQNSDLFFLSLNFVDGRQQKSGLEKKGRFLLTPKMAVNKIQVLKKERGDFVDAIFPRQQNPGTWSAFC